MAGTKAKRGIGKGRGEGIARRATTRRAPPKVLAPGERLRLAKPPSNYEELVEKMADRLEQLKGRVPSKVRSTQLLSLLKKARRARQKEERFEAKMAEKLVPLKDARLLADDAAWRAALKVWRAIKFAGEDDPTLLEQFQFFYDALPKKSGHAVEADGETTPEPLASGNA